MNGVCGSFSIFSSAHYLITNDDDCLWWAFALPLAGLMFDFFDGKVARWRKSTSLLGQELDSLADLVGNVSFYDRASLNVSYRSHLALHPLSSHSPSAFERISIPFA